MISNLLQNFYSLPVPTQIAIALFLILSCIVIAWDNAGKGGIKQ